MTTSATTRTIGIVSHPTKNIAASLDTVERWSLTHGVELLAIEGSSAAAREGIRSVETAEFIARVDAVAALGGDGTMLGAMRLVADRPVPVVGINYGNVGFLVEIEPRDLEAALDRIRTGDFQLEAHHALEVTLTVDGVERTLLAFNDAAIARRPGGGVISADLEVGGVPFGYYRADALVISTSGGSTAYNYAAGGPILSPGLAASVVTPVAPMAGINRAVVLASDEILHLAIGSGTRDAAVELDGLVVASLTEGSLVTIRLRVDAGRVVRLDSGRHTSKGLLKLSLLDIPLRPGQLLDLVPQQYRDEADRIRRERG